ncbi:MAG: DNA repair exonuclease [Bacillota bacterium]
MAAIKLVHVADVHLDTTLHSQNAHIRQRLRWATREAFRAAVDLCLQEGALALLVAGDLFDNHRLTLETERFLLEQVRRLDSQGVCFVYATGNHDPGLAHYRAQRIPWPPNVHLLASSTPQEVPLTGAAGAKAACVVGAGHETEREDRNLAQGFPGSKGSLPYIGLLHTFVAGAREGHERYAPCTIQDLTGKGYAYWALGHIHRREVVCDYPSVHYPGNLQGRNAREDGPKGALLVTVDPQGAHAEFRPLAPVEWLTARPLSLVDVESQSTLIPRIVQSLPGRTAPEFLLRVELAGPCPLYQELMSEEERLSLEDQLEHATGALSVEVRTRDLLPPARVEDFKQGPHILATALEILEEVRREGLSPGLADRPLAGESQGLAGFGDDEARKAYLLRIMNGAEVELVFRMVKPRVG